MNTTTNTTAEELLSTCQACREECDPAFLRADGCHDPRHETPCPHQALRLEWGLRDAVPDGAKLAWGARAIYSLERVTSTVRPRTQLKSITHRATIDLLWDRQGAKAALDVTEPERLAFQEWINSIGLPELRKICERSRVTQRDDGLIEHESDGYKIVASPRASHGYLYIAAWRV